MSDHLYEMRGLSCSLALALLAAPLPSQNPPAAPSRRPVTVLVVEPVGDRGIPNCQVDMLDYSVLEVEWGKLKIDPTFHDWRDLFASKGQHYTTNEFGTMIVPRPVEKCYFMASAPGLWCFFQMDSTDTSPYILRMEKDQELQVRVVDDQGAPVSDVQVGVTLALVPVVKAPIDDEKELWLTLAETGADGIAHLPHLQQWRQLQWWREHPDTELDGARRVTFGIPLEKQKKLEIDVWNPPKDPVKVVIPPTGRVIVPLPTGVRSYARVRTAWPNTDATTLRPWPTRVPYRVESPDGKAVFKRVGLNLELEYEVWWDGLSNPMRARAAGPTKPGEEVVLPPLHLADEKRAADPGTNPPR